MAQARRDFAAVIEIRATIEKTKEGLVRLSTIQQVLNFDKEKLTMALADPYSRQMIIDTMGSEF